MSKETSNWLNNNCLVGFTDKWGRAWHYNEAEQGEESNHYPNAIPVEDINRRLFDWEAVACEATYSIGDNTYSLPQKVIARSDTGAHLGTFSDGYEMHQYSEWLLDKVGALVDASDGDLAVGSAVLLQGGAVAAVQVELPEGVTVGTDRLRPFIVATTSFNGKYVTSYKRGTTRVVCDNTLDEFHASSDAAFKVKHTKHSRAKLGGIREALEIHFKHFEAEQQEIEALMNQAITDAEFDKIVALIDPVKGETDRGDTRVGNRQTQYRSLWEHDGRIGDYRNTAWGVVNVFNTFSQHLGTVRASTIRPEQNMLNFLGGKTGKDDATTIRAIKAVVGV